MRESQRLGNANQRPLRAEGLCLKLRGKRVERRRGEHQPLVRQGGQCLPKFCGGRGMMETAPRASRKEFGPETKMRQSMLSAESLKVFGRAQCRGGVAAHDFEFASLEKLTSHRRRMPELDRTAIGDFDEFACALDLAQAPNRHGEASGRHGASVLAVAFSRFLFMLGV